MADKALDLFISKYEGKYNKETDCLEKSRSELLTFYEFQAEHWKYIRSTNPIESTFATVRHRIKRTKGCLSRETAKVMVFKLLKDAERNWRKLDGNNQLSKVLHGVKFKDRCGI